MCELPRSDNAAARVQMPRMPQGDRPPARREARTSSVAGRSGQDRQILRDMPFGAQRPGLLADPLGHSGGQVRPSPDRLHARGKARFPFLPSLPSAGSDFAIPGERDSCTGPLAHMAWPVDPVQRLSRRRASGPALARLWALPQLIPMAGCDPVQSRSGAVCAGRRAYKSRLPEMPSESRGRQAIHTIPGYRIHGL